MKANSLIDRLRRPAPLPALDPGIDAANTAALDEFTRSGVRFVASSAQMEARFHDAMVELASCIKPAATDAPILHEGGIYYGCWLESTGTINAELLSRFMPAVAQATFSALAENQREDGLLPYKLTVDGPVFSQIQLVTPLARSVWNHYRLNGRNADFLASMYDAMSRYDAWLAEWRDTRTSGAVEAFCTYDTGHDLSARFWHMPDSPHHNDPKRYDRDNPLLPLIAPDLTATVACQRAYLAAIAEELGHDGDPWRAKAEASIGALFEQCFDREDGFFYDRDAAGRHLKVQSDVLLRVLACEIGDDAFFAQALERYLLNSRKFFAKFPLTSIALDDPRFDPAFDYNSWSGPTNFLTLIRTPHAFEHHGRYVELTWIIQPILTALFRSTRFSQTLNPFTGREGFTEVYSPSILCLFDFIERLCGILPRPDGTLWFTGLSPYQIEHRHQNHETGYSRIVDGRTFELVNTAELVLAYRDGEPLFECQRGIRIVTDRNGNIQALIGMSASTVAGELRAENRTIRFEVRPNERLDLTDGTFVSVSDPGLVRPNG